MADRISPIKHTTGPTPCGGLAYYAVSHPIGGSSMDVGHLMTGSPPAAGAPLVCQSCGAELLAVTNGSPRTIPYRPYDPDAPR